MNAILQSLLGIPPFVQDLSNLALLDNVHPQCLYKLVAVILLLRGQHSVMKLEKMFLALYTFLFQMPLQCHALQEEMSEC